MAWNGWLHIGRGPEIAFRLPLGIAYGRHYSAEYLAYFNGWHTRSLLVVIDRPVPGKRLRRQWQMLYRPLTVWEGVSRA